MWNSLSMAALVRCSAPSSTFDACVCRELEAPSSSFDSLQQTACFRERVPDFAGSGCEGAGGCVDAVQDIGLAVIFRAGGRRSVWIDKGVQLLRGAGDGIGGVLPGVGGGVGAVDELIQLVGEGAGLGEVPPEALLLFLELGEGMVDSDA